MRWLKAVVLAVGCGTLPLACSTGSGTFPGPQEEALGRAAQAIISACSFDTLGLPCDPDGPGKPKLECEGVCAISQSGLVTCSPAPEGSLDGVVCGTTAGIGNAACKHYCSGKACLNESAPAGAACRAAAGMSPCTGQCDGAGLCNAIASPCEFGRQEQLCQFNGCDFSNATSCVVTNLTRNTLCSDADACSIGRCTTGGACRAGATIGCDDGNSCTDDNCDRDSGACLGINNDDNSCSDGNACFTGEHCSAGSCIKGTLEVDCDDSNECTTDVCDPNTGCAHVAKCNDNNACTTDSCNPTTGVCSASEDVDCDDSDPCTVDDCASATGCTHVAIDGCGAGSGGAGGEGAGGQGGEPPVLVGGAGGEPPGNEAGQGGVPTTEPVGGSAGNGGIAGSGGSTAGTAGSDVGTAGTAVSGTGGQVTATAGSAGISSGGSTTAVGGAGGDDSSAGTGGNKVVDDGGCSCRTAGSSRPLTGSIAMALLGLVALARRRRALR